MFTAHGGLLVMGAVASENEASGTLTEASQSPVISNDAVVFGLLMTILGFVFWSSQSQWFGFRAFYRFVPMLLMCYFLPSLLTLFKIVDPHASQLYFVASRYLLPASLVLLTISVDIPEIIRLGPKALIMFITGTIGVIVGGPLAMLIVGSVAPDLIGGEGSMAVWRGLATIAGSWIGGAANQAAMFSVFEPDQDMFSAMAAVDVLVAEFWMMFLLLGIGQSKAIDRFFKADTTALERLTKKMDDYALQTTRTPTTTDLMLILGFGFGATAVATLLAEWLASLIGAKLPQLAQISLDSSFFWLVVIATFFGVILSFTPAARLEGAGASKVGTVFVFILVATIGLKMDLSAIVTNSGYFVIGLVWMLIHVGLLAVVGYLIRAPYFFLAIGSKANIGGAASAPVLAAAFHPALAPVGVLLAVLGYILGTGGAWLCAVLMRSVAAG